MFQEQIARETAKHFRTHAETYFLETEQSFTGSDKLSLRVPKIEAVSLVGGVMQAELSSLPIIGVDCLDKDEIPSNESLYLYQYQGAIVGMVRGTDAESTDKMSKRYQSVVERFIKEHRLIGIGDTNFSLREMLFLRTTFTGSMQSQDEDESVWLSGFATELLWITSEDGPRQHV